LSRIRTLTAAATVVAAATAFVAAPAAPRPRPTSPARARATARARTTGTTTPPRSCARPPRPRSALKHLEAFQAIADANGNTRASGTPGYDLSKDYVVAQLRAPATRPPCRSSSSRSSRTVDDDRQRDVDRDGQLHLRRLGTLSGAKIIPVDVQIPPPAAPGSTSGCEAADFAGLDFSGTERRRAHPARHVPFGQKALNAQVGGRRGRHPLQRGSAPQTRRT
jgi:hypothetical protein